MTAHGYTPTAKDPAIYMNGLWDCEGFVASGFWVNDFIGVGCPEGLRVLREGINDRYGVSSLGDIHWVLGMKLERDRLAHTILVSQEVFVDTLLTHSVSQMHIQSLCLLFLALTCLPPTLQLWGSSSSLIVSLSVLFSGWLLVCDLTLLLLLLLLHTSVATWVRPIGTLPNASCITSRGQMLWNGF